MVRNIVRQRIQTLFDEAADVAQDDIDRADRYIELAWTIKLSHNASFTEEQKRRFCKACKQYLRPSDTRYRCNNGVLTTTCLRCGAYRRQRYQNMN